MNSTQLIHDWLLEHKPESASHDKADCSFCKREIASEQEEGVTAEQKIFTQEQHEQLVASAVEKAATEAVATADGEVLRLNEQLEEAQKALTEREEKITDLEATISEREDQDRLAELATERIKLIAAAATFTDEQITARKEGWAKMSEEDFTAYLEDIRAVAKAPATDDKKVPDTKFDGTRETAGEAGSEKNLIEEFFGSSASAIAAQS